MKIARDIKKFVTNAAIQTNSEVNEAVFATLLRELDQYGRTHLPGRRLPLRRRIVRSRAAKLATAVVIIAIVGLGVVFFNKLDAPAYAIDQTIEALQCVSTVHVIGTNWDGKRYEAWNKINPETGKTEWICIDETPHGYKIASTPKGSCVWDGNGNVVRYSNKPIASNDFRYSQVFEQIAEKMVELNDGEHITAQTEKDPVSDESLIVIHVLTRMKDYRIYIDPESKLPVRLHFDRADNMQQIAKTVDDIYYNVPLPEGLFDFEVPAKWHRDWTLLDDPNKGLAIGDLTHEQGAIETAREYWQAVIDNNWDYADQLRPVADWKTDYQKDRPTELIDINQPRAERGCSGLVTPCIVRFADGKIQRIELVINCREIASRASCIIVATWGWPEMLAD